jgi:phosphocarrier protein
MITTKITVDNEVGLHARPATLFVKAAQKYEAVIIVLYDGNSANAKSLLSLLALGVGKGGEVTLTADGNDEKEALAALTRLIKENFGE